jgi:probable HAF family extracellular repeat protein
VEQLEDRYCPSSTSPYAITDLGTLYGGNSYAAAINNAPTINQVGQVAGQSDIAPFNGTTSHAFLWTQGATNGVPTNPQMRDLGTLPGFGTATVEGINDAGQVVGYAGNLRPTAAFYWNGTGMIDLGTLGLTRTYAYSLNNATASHGVEVVGSSWLVTSTSSFLGTPHAFLWQNGGPMVDLNTLLPASSGWVLSGATGINDNQQIVGTGSYDGTASGFVCQIVSGVLTEPTEIPVINNAAYGTGLPAAINSLGQVAGQNGVPEGSPVFWSNGTTTSLPMYPSSGFDFASGLNGSSQVQVVGYATDNTLANPNALLWKNSTVVSLISQISKSAQWSSLSRASGVNDAGQIVGGGAGKATGGAGHAFLLTPTTTATAAPAATNPATAKNLTVTAAPTQGPISQTLVLDVTAIPQPRQSLGQPPAPALPSSTLGSSGSPRPGQSLGQPPAPLVAGIHAGSPGTKSPSGLPRSVATATLDQMFADFAADLLAGVL